MDRLPSISAELMRAFCILIFTTAGVLLFGLYVDPDTFLTWLPWALAVGMALVYLPFGLWLHFRMDEQLRRGATPPSWLRVWNTTALDETVRGMAIFGIFIFLPGAIIYQIWGTRAALASVAMGWAVGLAYVPLGTWFRERGSTVGMSKHSQLPLLIAVEVLVVAALLGTSVATGSASWLEVLGGVLAAGAVLAVTVVWGRRRLS